MKNIYILLALFLFSLSAVTAQKDDFRKNPPKPGPAPKIELGEYQQFKLDNGMNVIVVENHKLPRVSFQLSIDVPLHLEKGAAGLSGIAGQLLKTGTTTRSKAQIDEAIDFIGASLNTSGSGIFASSLTKHQDALLELMSDVLYNPAFKQEEFDKIKNQTISGIVASKDSPDAIADNVADVLRYGKNHPYGEVATEATVENITLDLCKAYYQKYFQPSLAYLVIVGDINLKQAKAVADKYFSSWKGNPLLAKSFDLPSAPEAASVGFVNKTAAVQSVINITYPVEIKLGDDDRIAAALMNDILGSGSSGRLFKNIREDKGYTYGAYSNLSYDREIGYFNASASVRNEVTDSAIIEFLYELNRIRDEKVTAEELRNAKAERKGGFARGLESPQTIASFALNTVRYNLPKDYYATYLQKVDAVTIEDVQAAAKKYIQPDKANILVVGAKDGVAEKLSAFDADGEVDFYDIYGTKLQKFAAELPKDLDGNKVIDKYLNAIGGRAKLEEVKDATLNMKANVQGQPLEIVMRYKLPGKFSNTVSMMGNVMSKQLVNGNRATISQMGQVQEVPKEGMEEMKQSANPFPELEYEKNEIEVTLKGIESVEQKKAYVVTINKGNTITTDYFDASTFLKLRSISVIEGMGQKVTQQTDYADYKAVDGIQFPHTVTVSGLLPFPLKTTVDSIEINKDLSDDLFKIE